MKTQLLVLSTLLGLLAASGLLFLLARPHSSPVDDLTQPASAFLDHQSAVAPLLESDRRLQTQAHDELLDLPLQFVTNAGQADPAVHFTAQSLEGTLFFISDGVVLTLPGKPSEAPPLSASAQVEEMIKESPREAADTTVVRLQLMEANPTVKVEGQSAFSGVANFWLGNDPSRWRTNVPTFGGVIYYGVYEGIDLIYRGVGGQLKREFIVKPNADPTQIRMTYSGIEGVSLREDGALVLHTARGDLIESAPVAYQDLDGQRVEVPVQFALLDMSAKTKPEAQVRFELGAYDPDYPLVIDPVLTFSTYLGGLEDDFGVGIAIDSTGNIFVAGTTFSADFPTSNAIQDELQGIGDAFVTKIIKVSGVYTYGYSTYLGGSGVEFGQGIATDNVGNAYVTGFTDSTDFPTLNALQSDQPARDAFVTQITSGNGVLGYSTYLGGNDRDSGLDIAVDGEGNVYVAGFTRSTDFPTVKALQGDQPGEDAFVTKISSVIGGSSIRTTEITYGYSTYLGGNNLDSASGIAVDGAGNAYVTGRTLSTDFPTKHAIQNDQLDEDAFVSQIIRANAVYTYGYSTYLGGSSSDQGISIAVDGPGRAYIIGNTFSPDFPLVNPIRAELEETDPGDAFVTKIEKVGATYLYSFSSYLAGPRELYNDVAVDGGQNIYVTGFDDTDDDEGLRQNPVVTQLLRQGVNYTLGYRLGFPGPGGGSAIAVDSVGSVYVTGSTRSTVFPTVNALQPENRSRPDDFFPTLALYDAFVLQLTNAVPEFKLFLPFIRPSH
jgi:hypothetical protein